MEWTAADLITLRNVLCIHMLGFSIKKKKKGRWAGEEGYVVSTGTWIPDQDLHFVI